MRRARIKSLSNSLKNYTSVNEGFTKDRIVEARVARETQMRAASPVAATVLDELARLTAEQNRMRERDLILDWLVSRGSPMLQQAFTIVRLAQERPKKDLDREARFQERNWPALRTASERAQRTIDVPSDRAVVRYFLAEAAKLPGAQRVAALSGVTADELYTNTRLANPEERTKMFGETIAQLAARNDAMLNLAIALMPLL
ncbi:MAG TPA: S46 family peptidase, partial [Thermoanaerobaculia bacterium]